MYVERDGDNTVFSFRDARERQLLGVSLSKTQVRNLLRDIAAEGHKSIIARDSKDRRNLYMHVTSGDNTPNLSDDSLMVMATKKMGKGTDSYRVGVALGPIAVKRLVEQLAALYTVG
jgi:hypothetical protein